MQAIIVRYRGPRQNARGYVDTGAVTARSGRHRVTLECDPEIGDRRDDMTRAARALAVKMEWSGLWIGGVVVGPEHMVFVCYPTATGEAPPTITRDPHGPPVWAFIVAPGERPIVADPAYLTRKIGGVAGDV